jgi:hypothetical protein
MPDDGLKYAMALPLQPAVETKIARLIKFADEHLDFFVKRWQRREIAKLRKGPMRWFRRNRTDEQILKDEVEGREFFWGYDWVKEYRCPMEVQPSTRSDLQSILDASAYYRSTRQTGFAYNSRYIVDYLSAEDPKITDWKSE